MACSAPTDFKPGELPDRPDYGQTALRVMEGGSWKWVTERIRRIPIVTGPPTETLAKIGLGVDVFNDLIEKARSGQQLRATVDSKARFALGLASYAELKDSPEYWVGPDVKYGDLTPRAVPEDWAEQVDLALESNNWDYFKPRVKGSFALLRMRMRDIPQLYNDRPRLRSNLMRLGRIQELIQMQNLLVWAWCVEEQGFDGLRWLDERGALDSPEHFEMYTKALTGALKASSLPDSYMCLVELSGLSGFRLLPDEKFDVVKEVEATSEGLGVEHSTTDGLAHKWGWLDCTAVLDALPASKPVAPPSVPGFVAEARDWVTSGSSSLGRLEYEIDGRKQHTKARKLMLPYALEWLTLLPVMMAGYISVTVAVIKSELSKIRIAVAGDLGFYLNWAYLHRLSGDVYNQWNGVTLAETPLEEFDRMEMMLACCDAGSVGLPLDYKAFDSQTNTVEVVAIGLALLASALRRALAPLWLVWNAISGLKFAQLSTPKSAGPVRTFTVKNYLPSGIAITSAVGNGFNCVAAESMICLVEAWTRVARDKWLTQLALRGDDSSFMVTKPAFALLLTLAGQVLGYVFARMKISITPARSELLRVHYSSLGARGYWGRLIPALMQRKPWSNEPWDPEGVVRAWFATCMAIQRRGGPGMDLWDKCVTIWSRIRGLPGWCLGVPVAHGGLGLGRPYSGSLGVPLGRIDAVRGVSVAVSEWSQSLEQARYADVGFSITPAEAKDLAHTAAIGTLQTVDLPEFAAHAQAQYRDGLSFAAATAVGGAPAGLRNVLFTAWLEGLYARLIWERGHPWQTWHLLAPTVNWGTDFALSSRARAARTLARTRRVRWKDLLEPGEVQRIEEIARWLHAGAEDAADWLGATGPSGSQGAAHPQISALVTKVVAGAVEEAVRQGVVAKVGLHLTWAICAWTLGSAASQNVRTSRVYRW